MLSKTDLMDEAARARAEARIAGHLARAVKIVPAANGQARCLGAARPGAGGRGRHREPQRPAMTAPSTTSTMISTLSFVELPGVSDPEELARKVSAAAEAENALAGEGVLPRVEGKRCGFWCRRSARAWPLLRPSLGGRRADRGTRLVVIGLKGLDRAAIRGRHWQPEPMHLLATSTATLDDLIEPIDLAQQPAEMVVLSPSPTAISRQWPPRGAQRLDRLPTLRLASLRDLRHPMSVDLWLDAVATQAKIVLVRVLGGYEWWRYGCDRLSELARKKGIHLALLPGECREHDERLSRLSTLAQDELSELLACLS